MKNIVIVTSNEIRHKYFKIFLSNSKKINTLKTYVESNSSNDLSQINISKLDYSSAHLLARNNTEYDFFSDFIETSSDQSNTQFIDKGEINSEHMVKEIIELKPDIIITYGCSLIKYPLINSMRNKIINVHLGLSPYYYGAGTNFHAMVNNDFQCVGYTFMYMDEGIDTGEIIHQARAHIEPFDNPHQIGNRLIKIMTKDFMHLIENFHCLKKQTSENKFIGKTYKIKDASDKAVEKLYKNFQNGCVIEYLKNKSSKIANYPITQQKFMRNE